MDTPELQKNNNWSVVLKHLFLTSLFFSLIIFIIDPFVDGFTQEYINFAWLTVWVIVTGLLSIITNKQGDLEGMKAPIWLKFSYLLITLLVGLWVAWTIRDLGWQAWLLGLLTTLVSWGILYGVIEKDQSTND